MNEKEIEKVFSDRDAEKRNIIVSFKSDKKVTASFNQEAYLEKKRKIQEKLIAKHPQLNEVSPPIK